MSKHFHSVASCPPTAGSPNRVPSVRQASPFRFPLSGFYCLLSAFCLLSSFRAHAAIQFDVFLGFDGIVPEAAWFPVVFEVKNDGPSFNGVIEFNNGNLDRGQSRKMAVELPTGTLKRLLLPVFAGGQGFGVWEARLLDDRGRLRAEQPQIQPRKRVASSPLVGAIPRSPGGAPEIRSVLSSQADLQPATARMLPALFPDNPLVLERMDCLYLNSEKAADLSSRQVEALLAWVHMGGHLVVAVEQPSDVSSSQWLKSIFPVEVRDVQTVSSHAALQDWLTSSDWPAGRPGTPTPRKGDSLPELTARPFAGLPADMTFEAAPLRVAIGAPVRGAKVVMSVEQTPLVVEARQGRGRVTALCFSPEREPVRSWKNLPVFWARIAEVPPVLYQLSEFNQTGGYGGDGILGAMLDSRQVHKLPIGWLLLLLLLYLVVIGPFDYFLVRRLRRPMLTWITFPFYVLLFSGTIYLIGYKLRAGESEWNELHIVDVLPKNATASLRGRTAISVYSPANQRYPLAGEQSVSLLRNEFAGSWGGSQSDERCTFWQNADRFSAEVFVPVWTSRLLVNDWLQDSSIPLTARVTRSGSNWSVRVENRTSTLMGPIDLVFQGRLVRLGQVEPSSSRTFDVNPVQGQRLLDFVLGHSGAFSQAVQSRQYAFGNTQSGRIDDLVGASQALSFLRFGLQSDGNAQTRFVLPPGWDMSPLTDPDTAVVLAWSPNHSPARPVRQFSSKRNQKSTLWRLVVPTQ